MKAIIIAIFLSLIIVGVAFLIYSYIMKKKMEIKPKEITSRKELTEEDINNNINIDIINNSMGNIFQPKIAKIPQKKK